MACEDKLNCWQIFREGSTRTRNHRRPRKNEHLKSRKMLKCANIKLPPIDWDVIKKATQTKSGPPRPRHKNHCPDEKSNYAYAVQTKGIPPCRYGNSTEAGGRRGSIWGSLLMLTGLKCGDFGGLWATYINANINYSPYMRMTNLRLMSGLWCCRPQSFSIHILLATSQ